MAMLEVKDLQVYYGVIQALKGISFEVNQGEVIALIGSDRVQRFHNLTIEKREITQDKKDQPLSYIEIDHIQPA